MFGPASFYTVNLPSLPRDRSPASHLLGGVQGGGRADHVGVVGQQVGRDIGVNGIGMLSGVALLGRTFTGTPCCWSISWRPTVSMEVMPTSKGRKLKPGKRSRPRTQPRAWQRALPSGFHPG
jgi:hypothetical protein